MLGTVRARTTFVATLVLGAALLAGSAALLVTVERSLVRNGDDAAVARARDLASVTALGTLPATLTAAGEDDFIQVVDGSGAVLASTANVRGRAALLSLDPPAAAPVLRTVREVRGDDEPEDYRVVAVSAATPEATVYVARSLEAVGETMSTLRAVLAVGLPLMLAAFAAIAWYVVGRALRPVEAIRSEVAAVSQEALDHRVPVPATDDEISRLARTMNAMLDRLESASRRQREFVADASHELQSPLAAVRAQLEVSLARPETTDWRATATDVLADATRMEGLIRDLLYLAREDAAAPRPPELPVDLDDVVLQEAARLRASGRVRVDTAGVSAAPVLGSREQLARMVRNLLDNAGRHARSLVRVEVLERDGGAELAVADDGPGVPVEHRERIFDRFVRVDAGRGRDEGGTGLGLAIVDAIARRHGGTVRLEEAGGGSRFVVRLPLAGTGAPLSGRSRAGTPAPRRPVGAPEPR